MSLRHDLTVVLESTRPLAEMSTADNLTDCLEIWTPQAPGTLRVCPGLYKDCFTFFFFSFFSVRIQKNYKYETTSNVCFEHNCSLIFIHSFIYFHSVDPYKVNLTLRIQNMS